MRRIALATFAIFSLAVLAVDAQRPASAPDTAPAASRPTPCCSRT